MSSQQNQKVLKVFGGRVRAARKRAGLTQEQLAAGADLATRNVQRIEAGELDILLSTLLRLKEALGADASDLI